MPGQNHIKFVTLYIEHIGWF